MPKVSCLCVTENRAAFMPWLLWCFDRQTHADKELIIVDSSATPFAARRSDVKVHPAPAGSNVPQKRNLALAHASGDLIAWFDDDDWQHPRRLELLVAALKGGTPFAGVTHGWFVDLFSGRSRPYSGGRSIIFNSALFRREVATSTLFDERRRKASDTHWMRQLGSQHGPGRVVRAPELMFWLCHDVNISNPRSRRAFSDDLGTLRVRLEEAWGDTDRELEALRRRLPAPALATPWVPPPPSEIRPTLDGAERRAHRLLQAKRLPGHLPASSRRAEGQPLATAPERHLEPAPAKLLEPPAGVTPSPPARAGARLASVAPSPPVLDVTLLASIAAGLNDTAPFLPHIARQAGCSLREAVGFAPALTGERRRAMEQLARERVVERVVEGHPKEHALLRALRETEATFVLVALSPLLCYRASESWVASAVACLNRDPSLLLVTVQAGPSAGAPGSPHNRPVTGGPSTWDRRARLWRQQGLASPIFVARRCELSRLLAGLAAEGDPELWLSTVLRGRGAACGTLADRKWWAVRVSGRAAEASAPRLIAAIEGGSFPRALQGRSSVVVDELEAVRAWSAPGPSAAPCPGS